MFAMMLSGAIAGAVTYPLVKLLLGKRLKGNASTFIAAGVALLASLVVRVTITDPIVLPIHARASAEELIQKDEMLRLLLDAHPELKAQMEQMTASAMLKGDIEAAK